MRALHVEAGLSALSHREVYLSVKMARMPVITGQVEQSDIWLARAQAADHSSSSDREELCCGLGHGCRQTD